MKLLLTLAWLCWGLIMVPAALPIATPEIQFHIKNAGLTVDGTLSGGTADVQFDPAHPEQARIKASVPVSSIQTGISLRDKHLQKPEYFDAATYPAIAMQSKSIRKTGQNQYEGTFALTIKGTTKEVTVPFTVANGRELSGQFKLNRLDFNVGKNSMMLSDDVKVDIRVVTGK